MKYIFILLLLYTSSFAFFDNLNTFQANFTQTVTDENNKVLSYSGSVVASKPQNAVWTYTTPIKKEVYIDINTATVIEPEIEQVIIKHIESNFSFFNMINNAKKIKENVFVANYKESKFTIITKNDLIESISYIDEFENKVKIVFKNQKQNEAIDLKLFVPNIPENFDIINN